ncbi:hypothetical protein EVAR_73121_1, partial [Eumeta japonica]
MYEVWDMANLEVQVIWDSKPTERQFDESEALMKVIMSDFPAKIPVY